MGKVKMHVKRIWNSKCKYLVIVACALILANGVNLLQAGLKFLNENGEESEEIKSVEIESDDWENREPGSFHINKSAEWTGYKEATIRFDVDTTKKVVIEKNEEVIEGIPGADIILVLDTSGSMKTKDRLVKVKDAATSLTNEILSEGNHKIALISFDSNATLKSSFTNDKSRLISQINSLSPGGETSYKNAYQAVISLLSGYEQNKNRDLVMIFLTDGSGGSAASQYSILKGKYNITIVAIQYAMGTSIKSALKKISDKQYIADTSNIKSILYQTIRDTTTKIQTTEFMKTENYEIFEISDYISKEFYVKNIDDISVSTGTVKLETTSDETQKVVWQVSNGDFSTGSSATMTIKTTYQGEMDTKHVYPTNQKEEISTKLKGEDKKILTSELTPQLRVEYSVTYNPNLPSTCNSDGKNLTTTNFAFPYEELKLPKNEYTCEGWQFKGWGFDPEASVKDDDTFIVPPYDVKVVGMWTKIDVSKTMDGAIYSPVQELVMAMKENSGTVSVDTGINFASGSSASNGRGLYIRSGTETDTNPIYYYRGNVNNNNVLFAGICWQIVRTTETGGIKLIYNGTSNDGKTCNSRGNSYIGESIFNSNQNSPAYVGYMYGTVYTGKVSTTSFSNYYFGQSVTYDSSTGKYTLVSTTKGGPTTGYHYTCQSTSASGTCSTVLYVEQAEGFGSGLAKKYLSFSGGDTLETALSKMNTNTNNSSVKTKIDSWYKTNIGEKGYTKYLEDAVWCNDRKIASGGLLSETAGYSEIYYASRGLRNLDKSTANPAIKDIDACANVKDRFTTKDANVGNKALIYPVGLLTVDEVSLAGMTYFTLSSGSTDSYLYTGYHYWTITPFSHDTTTSAYYSYVVAVRNNGVWMGVSINDTSYKVRPSIALKAETLVSVEGNGTKEKPYVVITE